MATFNDFQMKKTNYWKSIDELQHKHLSDGKTADITSTPSPVDILSDPENDKASSRRDFLKWCGISFFSATVMSACENPVKKAIPYLTQPEELTPGKATWYASTYQHGNEYCPILVKNRDGRPIKIEGNDLSKLTGGGSPARVQASLLGLYDDGARYHHPMKNGSKISWDDADGEIIGQIRDITSRGGRAAMVTPTLLSPATNKLIGQLQQTFPGLEVISWDAISYEAIRKSHRAYFGMDAFPQYHFNKAALVLSFGADFLGTWAAPSIYARQYATKRKISQENPNISRHIQIESWVSLTGANADTRIPVKPSDEKRILLALYHEMISLTGDSNHPVIPEKDKASITSLQGDFDIRRLAEQLLELSGSSIVVCGQNDLGSQLLVCAINQMAGNYGQTITMDNPLMIGQGDDATFEAFAQDLISGSYDAVMFYDVNPVYQHPDGQRLHEAIRQLPLSISFAGARDETAEACTFILPDNHYLEAWNDARFQEGCYSLAQPAIHAIYNTRQAQDTLLRWLGSDMDFHGYLRDFWMSDLFPLQSEYADNLNFWLNTLQKGVFELTSTRDISYRANPSAIPQVVVEMQQGMRGLGKTELVVYTHLATADGHMANNPWLQEMPDPITSVTWDNFIAVSPAFANREQLREGDIILLNGKAEAPVLIQPGMADDCMAISTGYGRTRAGKVADNRGCNAFTLGRIESHKRILGGAVVSWEKTGGGFQFARTQTHFSMEGRAIVRESTIDKYRLDPAAGNELHAYHEKHKLTLYPEDTYEGHHWALMVDLNACTGCSSCVISCQSENNVPVVGKDEVRRRRIMHWMRIDRYYNGSEDNPGIVFQPVMCMHCDHAPCENVCPVAATTHSSEGINQITYNRCVGTKYCINNCPYKVRRFNWFAYAQNDKFDYHMNSDMGRMVLNPDVTVRERGVVEKCSFCVQRIQEAKLKAKKERRPLRDGEVIPACVQSCPSGALVFGDVNLKDSQVAMMIKDPRNYHLLEELHTLPSVGYLTKIRNR